MDEQTNQLGEMVERAKDDITSQQPRFHDVDPNDFYISVMDWIIKAEEVEPPYAVNSRRRDNWLSNYWHQEPHLAGVLHSLISIDSNRGWTLTGGRNQVIRYRNIIHNWMAAPGTIGYRSGVSSAALSFYTTDLGAIIENGRDGDAGPLRGFFHVDPTQCRLSGNREAPLKYKPVAQKEADWALKDYMRVVSMPSILEKFNGLGYCFESRALDLAKIMVAVYQHDLEQLGAQAPRGLLLLKGIAEKQFNNAMEARKEKAQGEGWKYFAAVAVLATSSIGADLDAKLVALSNLPAGFDIQKWTAMMMYGYALCAGYDPSEFYPVQFGSIGRGTETEVQHMKATGKGGLNFALSLQEQMQRPDILPDTLEFGFEQRDDAGALLEASVQQAWVNVYKAVRETGAVIADVEGGITRDEFRSLLAEKGIIPREWTEIEEESEATDTGEDDEDVSRWNKNRRRDYLMSLPYIYRVIETFPDDAIVRYGWPKDKVSILWERAGTLTDTRVWRMVKRQDEGATLYDEDGIIITEGDVNRAIDEGRKRVSDEFGQLLDAEVVEGANEPDAG